MILRFLRISKRFYNPPTKKSWSKQHPDFRTRRPLVEPYNLGRLHPEKEWWKLPKKGLSPSTFMGFPDVAHLEKRGGSLYANLMDGNTLSMVIYRAIQHDVKDAQIWHSLTRQALKLAMSLDPYVVSLLFLYLSRSNWYDHQFIVTFTGRILATLSEFTIVECANVLMAMENTKFFHEKTQKHVIQHAESLCLSDIRSITVDDALKLLAVIKQDMMGVDNILVALGEIVEVSDISTTDEMVLIQSMEALCNIRDRVDRLCVTRIFDELCNRLEADKMCNHARNIAILQAMTYFHYRRPMAIELIQQRLHNNVHTANTLEMCQYMYFSTVTDRCLPSDDVYSKLSIRCVRKHALKNIEQFMDDLSLAVKYVVVCLNSTAPMDPKEVNMLRDVLGKHDQLGKEDILILYEALANAQNELPEDTMAKTRELVRQAWDMLPTLSIRDCSLLMNHGKLDICAMVGAQAVEELFQRLTSDIKQLESDVVLRLVEFASKQNHLSTRMIGIIEVDPSIIPVTATAAVAVLELYLNAGRSCDSKACKWARDKLTNRRTIIDPRYSERMQRIVDRISTHNAS